ncbi:MAG: hypothetical protein M3Q42_07525 [Pseudomonadota bacterium]|nr:hypothetical protein [Pseudomonadota bacterium]
MITTTMVTVAVPMGLRSVRVIVPIWVVLCDGRMLHAVQIADCAENGADRHAQHQQHQHGGAQEATLAVEDGHHGVAYSSGLSIRKSIASRPSRRCCPTNIGAPGSELLSGTKRRAIDAPQCPLLSG